MSKWSRAPFQNGAGIHFQMEPGSIPNRAVLHVRASFPNGAGLHFKMEPGFISKWSRALGVKMPCGVQNFFPPQTLSEKMCGKILLSSHNLLIGVAAIAARRPRFHIG
jgi:hypothetical protein